MKSACLLDVVHIELNFLKSQRYLDRSRTGLVRWIWKSTSPCNHFIRAHFESTYPRDSFRTPHNDNHEFPTAWSHGEITIVIHRDSRRGPAWTKRASREDWDRLAESSVLHPGRNDRTLEKFNLASPRTKLCGFKR